MTIKEIAEIANVSPGTVDRVLHNRGEVSKKTKEKILKIINDGNYTPNVFARNLVLNKTYQIASILPKFQTDEYWEGPVKGIQQAVQELKMLGIQNELYFFQHDNALEFEKIASEVIQSNPDGILLAPVIYDKALWFSEMCAKFKIPLIIFDSNIPEAYKLSFIGQNALKSGALAAKLLNISSTSSRVFIITITTTGDNNAIIKQRKLGFSSYFKALPNPVTINQLDLHLEDPDLHVQLENFVKGLGNNEKLFVPNSKVHILAKVIYDLGKSSSIRLVGYDIIKNNLKYLETDTIDFLINQKPEQQGYQGLQLFYKYLVLKQEVQKEILMPLEIVTKENIEFISF